MTEIIKSILKEIRQLEKRENDCVGYDFGNGKAIYVQVIGTVDGFEYMYEADNILDGAYEPYSSWNASSVYGDMEEATETLATFIEEWALMD